MKNLAGESPNPLVILFRQFQRSQNRLPVINQKYIDMIRRGDISVEHTKGHEVTGCIPGFSLIAKFNIYARAMNVTLLRPHEGYWSITEAAKLRGRIEGRVYEIWPKAGWVNIQI